MALFKKTDADDTLQAAQSALDAAVARIAELSAARAAKLEAAEGDYLTEVGRLDKELQSLHANCAVHRDRIAAQQQRAAKLEQVRRVQAKTDAIAAIKKLLPKRQAAAQRLDVALCELGEAFASLELADNNVFLSWPTDALPAASHFTYLRLMISQALSGRRVEKTLPGLVRALAQAEVQNFAAMAAKHDAELISALEAAPLPAMPEQDAA